MNENEINLMQIISYSGNAHSLCMEALNLYRSKRLDEGQKKYAEAKEELIKAKRVHSELLKQFACGDIKDVNLLAVHAEDHLSFSQAIYEMVNEFYYLYLDKNK